MISYYFNTNGEIVITDEKSINILQRYNPTTNEMFKDEDEAIKWATEYVQTVYNEKILTKLEVCQLTKISEIAKSCSANIISGFESKAFDGTNMKIYGSSVEDQANITGNALSALSKVSGIEGCKDDKFYYHPSGEDFQEWTPESCLQLARDFKIFKETQLLKSKILQKYVLSLDSEDTINNISWDTVVPSEGNASDVG